MPRNFSILSGPGHQSSFSTATASCLSPRQKPPRHPGAHYWYTFDISPTIEPLSTNMVFHWLRTTPETPGNMIQNMALLFIITVRISNIALLLPRYIIKSGDRTKLLGRFTSVYKITFQERKGSEVKEHESGEVWCFNFKLDTVRRLWIRRACLPPELLLLLFSSGYEIHGCTICIMLIFHKNNKSQQSIHHTCQFYFDANSTFSAIDLLFRLIFNLAIKYGDIVNRNISFVATSSNPLKDQLQRKKSRLKEKQSYLMQNAQYKTVFVKSEQPGPEKDCRFLWSYKNV